MVSVGCAEKGKQQRRLTPHSFFKKARTYIASSPAPPPKNMAPTTNDAMDVIFPDALTPLAEADPEVHGIIEDEKVRQW